MPGMFLINDDCVNMLEYLVEGQAHLIFTSPPYADARKTTYGGVPPEKYVRWFLERSAVFQEVLTDTGSMVINIKEGCRKGERLTYVLELILALRKQGWFWTEEYVWSKIDSMPGYWPNRFRDSWERLLHFTKQRDFKMRQDAVKVPYQPSVQKRLEKLGRNDFHRQTSVTGSGFGRNLSNWVGRDGALPTNVLTGPTANHNKAHPAVMPNWIAEFFIQLFTDAGETVCDPFAGSGTTLETAESLRRRSWGFETQQQYVQDFNDRWPLFSDMISGSG